MPNVDEPAASAKSMVSAEHRILLAMTESTEMTMEDLEAQIARAAYFTRMTIPSEQFRAILNLAMRVKAFDISHFGHLAMTRDREDVSLTGQEIRRLLMLALHAKRTGLPPRPRPVYKAK